MREVTFQFAHLVVHLARFDARHQLDGQFLTQLDQIQWLWRVEQSRRHVTPHGIMSTTSTKSQSKHFTPCLNSIMKLPFESWHFPLAVLVEDFTVDAHQHGVHRTRQSVVIHLEQLKMNSYSQMAND